MFHYTIEVLYNSSGSLITKTYHKNRYIKEDDVFTDVGYTNIYPGKSSHIYVPIEITGDKDGNEIFRKFEILK